MNAFAHPSGCVTTQATVPAANRAEITSQLATILHYITRQALQQALDQRSGGDCGWTHRPVDHPNNPHSSLWIRLTRNSCHPSTAMQAGRSSRRLDL